VTTRAKEHETLDFGATEVNDDIWLATCKEGQSQDPTPAKILREQAVAAQPAATRGYAVDPAAVPGIVNTLEVGEVQPSADGGQMEDRQQ